MMYSFSRSRTNSNTTDLEKALLPEIEISEPSPTYMLDLSSGLLFRLENTYALCVMCIFLVFIIILAVVIIYHIMQLE